MARTGRMLMVLFWCSLLVLPAQAMQWNSTEIGTPQGDSNTFPAVSVDALGVFYAAWQSADEGAAARINIEQRDGSGWTTVTSFTPLDLSVTSFGDGLSLALDASGGVHLAFQAVTGSGKTAERAVWYGYFTLVRGWSFDKIDAYTDPRGWKGVVASQLALDSSGIPRIAFVFSDNNEAPSRTYTLRYAVRDGVDWTVSDLHAIVGAGKSLSRPSLFIDANNFAHLSFLRVDLEQDLYYGTDATGSWGFTNVVPGSPAVAPGQPSSLVVDSAGTVHIVHHEANNATLNYLNNGTGSWIETVLDDGTGGADDVGQQAALTINALDTLAVAYQKNYGSGIKLASRIKGEAWVFEDAYVNGGSDLFVAKYIGVAQNNKNKIAIFHDRKLSEGDKRVMASLGSEPPVLTAPTAPAVAEDMVNVALADDVHVSDINGDDQTVTVTVSGGTVTLGVSGITFGGSGNGSASFTAAGNLTDINTALDVATFTPTANLNGTDVATISFKSNDGTVDSSDASVTFDIAAVNDDPEISGLPTDITVTEDDASDVDLSAATISDVDAGTNSITLTIRAASGTFSANSAGDVTSVGSGTGTIALTGTVADVDSYLNTASNVQYTSALNATGDNATTLTLTVNDGGNTGSGGGTDVTFGTVNVDIVAVNDAPNFSAGANLTAVDEDTFSPSGATVSSLMSDKFSDLDSDFLAGIAVSADSSNTGTEGDWEYSTDGSNWYDIGSVSTASALLLSSATSLRFVPLGNYNGTPGSLTVYAVDSSSVTTFTIGITTQSFDTTTDVATSKVSEAGVSVGTSINAVNDLPAFTSPAPLTTATEAVTYSITITADDDDSDPLTLSVPVLPGWLTFIPGTGLLEGTPAYDDIGDHNVTLRVSDGTVDVDDGFVITVAFTDADGDGLPDTWEIANGFDPAVDNSRSDTDGDGFLSGAEFTAGTDPANPDTDGDGLSDNVEVLSGLDPLINNSTLTDSDGDGLPDDYETAVDADVGNSPTADSDGDGISDRLEYLLGLDPTDPADEATDSDGDGISDLIETMAGLDPNDPADALLDSDGDGMVSLIELANGTSPVIDDALLADSDDDGIPDLTEWLVGLNPLVANTPPADSDGDGVSDLQEYLHGTLATPNANVANSDSDSLPDIYEVSIGTDPNNPDSDGDGSDDATDIFPVDATLICTGDINMNGAVEVVDAMLALRLSVGLDTMQPDSLMYGDVAPMLGGLPDPDTQINAADAMLILRKALGLVNW